MEFSSINPYNGATVATFKEDTQQQIEDKLQKAAEAFTIWRDISFSNRAKVMMNVSNLLLANVNQYAQTITAEMGKPITEARAEVKKCAWVCTYYAQNAEKFLERDTIETDAQESFVTNEPIGCVLAIMPWNFPFWQVFRFAAPALMAGNVGILKHASNVFGCAKHIEQIFEEAGCPEGVFQNLFIHHDKVPAIIGGNVVKAVTLTGSERAGAAVAACAGQHIKKSLLELGGSNAFIVLDDADIDKAVAIGVKARMMNAGQSCIAAKRFMVHEKVYDEFLAKFVEKVKALKSGDTMDYTTEVGPLARIDLASNLDTQVQASVQQGAILHTGGRQNGAYYEPTVLSGITTDMPVFTEETFGPVAPIIKVKDAAEAFRLARQTKFGLGVSLFTRDIAKAKTYISEVGDGAFFINDMVKSDPRLPFGGTSYSGYGRELSKDGILEFVNRKTVYIAG